MDFLSPTTRWCFSTTARCELRGGALRRRGYARCSSVSFWFFACSGVYVRERDDVGLYVEDVLLRQEEGFGVKEV